MQNDRRENNGVESLNTMEQYRMGKALTTSVLTVVGVPMVLMVNFYACFKCRQLLKPDKVKLTPNEQNQ